MLRKIPLHLEYLQGTDKIWHTVMPLDMATRNGAEWLKFKVLDGGETEEIRLDAIIAFAERLGFWPVMGGGKAETP